MCSAGVGGTFDNNAIDHLAFVRAAQAVGLTLGEIRQVPDFRRNGGMGLDLPAKGRA